MKVFQIGLQMTLDKFPYGGGRKLLASMLQSSGTLPPLPLPLPTPTLPLSSANAGSLGSKNRIKTQNPTKDLKLAMQREKES